MRTITTTEARKNIKKLIDLVCDTGDVIGIGRHKNIEVVIMKYPRDFNQELNDISNINTNSESFSFLRQEPDIYSKSDLKRKYA